ncbi:methyltransferase, FkbM family [compost metagenome]
MALDEISNSVLRRWSSKVIHDNDFYGFHILSRNAREIMDVGANLGQSVVSFRILFPEAKIYSYEANPLLISRLEKLASSIPGENHVSGFGLGNKEGEFSLHIPYAGDEPYLEEASISEDYYNLPWVKQKFIDRGGLEKLERVSCKIKTGDSQCLSPDIIKVDVEGVESLVLEGLIETIKRCRPVILVENSDWNNVMKIMESLNYAPFKYSCGDNIILPMSGETTNTFFVYQGMV